MKRSLTRVAGAVAVLVLAAGGILAGTATADGPPATATHAFASGTASTLACNGTVAAKVTISGQPQTTGQASAVMLVLDGSGSIGSGTNLTALKNAAKAALTALDGLDGTTDQEIKNNTVGIVRYSGSSASVVQPIGSSYATLWSYVDAFPNGVNGSPHGAGINAAAAALGSSGARAIVLISDGVANSGEASAAASAATAAKGNGIQIGSVGIGSSVNATNLSSWASPGAYQPATTFDAPQLLTTLGALKVTPLPFTLTETLGAGYTSADALSWSGALTDTQPKEFTFTATRTGPDPVSVKKETVSTLSATGNVTVSSSPLAIDVLPCGGASLASQTCTGACTTTGSDSGTGTAFALTTSPSQPADIFLTSFAGSAQNAPPSGVCAGFSQKTPSVQFDIRPLSTDATFEITIPAANLGSTKWWQTKVCFGTNLPFITAIESLATLRKAATPSGDRYWGLLPSIPRLVKINDKWVVGPWITSRSQKANGDAVIQIKVPYVPGSVGTDGNPGFDPKLAGG